MNEKIICGDSLNVLKTLESESVDCVITSPPYWGLRDYGVKEQLGLEPDFEDYIKRLVAIFVEAKRVMKKTGTCWVNMGDTYSAGDVEGFVDATDNLKYAGTTANIGGRKKKGGSRMPSKCLMQIPFRFSIAMVDAGFILRNIIVWHKPNAMPTSVTDRFTCDWEPIFFFSKSKRYNFEQQLEKSLWADKDARAVNGPSSGGKAQSGEYAIDKGGAFRKDGMRNTRATWSINTKPYSEAHFATYSETLVQQMLLPGCPKGGTVLDPFSGAATTGVVAKKNGRNYIGIELNPEYVAMSERRLAAITPPLF